MEANKLNAWRPRGLTNDNSLHGGHQEVVGRLRGYIEAKRIHGGQEDTWRPRGYMKAKRIHEGQEDACKLRSYRGRQ